MKKMKDFIYYHKLIIKVQSRKVSGEETHTVCATARTVFSNVPQGVSQAASGKRCLYLNMPACMEDGTNHPSNDRDPTV